VHDRQTGETTRIYTAPDDFNIGDNSPTISNNGRYVAFVSYASNLVPGDTNDDSDIFVHDRQTGETTRVSVASDGTQGNNYAGNPSISADGRYVAFVSRSRNLVDEGTDGEAHEFVHDRQTGETILVSAASDGTQGNGQTWASSISADGSSVVFYSNASNLVPGDTNGESDAFVADVAAHRELRATEEYSVYVPFVRK
jgi:Tol biopolymer transport system component